MKIGKQQEKDPTLAKPARMGHPEAFFGIKARPPAQVVKLYQYMHSASLAVYWPDKKSNQVYLQGRPCLGYERVDNWILDPDTLRTEHPLFTKSDDEYINRLEVSTEDDPTK